MKQSIGAVRLGALLLAAAIMTLSAGCGWFRGRSNYEYSPEGRPLEVPPDLDTPAYDAAMRLPEVPNAPAALGGAATGTVARATEVRLQDAVDSAWRRLGLALERIESVTINDRAELLSVYNVSYRGSDFLLRVTPDRGGARIAAVDAAGRELASGTATELLGQLQQRLH